MSRRYPSSESFARAALLIVLIANGCDFTAKHHEVNTKVSANRQATSSEFDPRLAPFCVETMFKNPSQAFHFSSLRRREGAGNALSLEANVSPTKIDLTSHTGTSTTTNHYQRNDESGWAMAIRTMVSSVPGARPETAKFAAKRAGSENIAGFETVKYVVDTTHEDRDGEASPIYGTGLKDYDTVGSFWVTNDTGCILKYVIDETDYDADGTVGRTHYQGVITRR